MLRCSSPTSRACGTARHSLIPLGCLFSTLPFHPRAGIVTTDAQQQQPLGVMHMLAGVQAAAASHWNASHPDQSLGLVALELDLSPRGAAMLAAPGADGGVRRLRVRAVKQGVVELLPRDAPPEGASAAAGAVALPWAAAGAAGEGAWPLTSVHPSQLQVCAASFWPSSAQKLAVAFGLGAAQVAPACPLQPCMCRAACAASLLLPC